MNAPRDPIAAVTHIDPYPYYAELAATRPLYYDTTLGLWIASNAAMVDLILQHPHCRVRPMAEAVPKALLGSPAATIFQHLVRMNDGAGHCPFKGAVSATLASVDAAHAAEQSRRWARLLVDSYVSSPTSDQLSNFAFHLPVYVVGSLLGVPADMLHQIALWVGDFVRCIAPTSSAEQVAQGKGASTHLLDTFRLLVRTPPRDSLLGALICEAARVGRSDSDVIIANGIGFLSQAYEATAGLIGNTLLALAAHESVSLAVSNEPSLLRNVVLEVLRYDPPIQNTRRFLAEDAIIAGHEMHAGDGILVVLAAANRDPMVNVHPERFDPFRSGRRVFTFGLHAHACPGEALAPAIAQAGVEALLQAKLLSDPVSTPVTYRPSANARIPMLFDV